jgi:hypothetical protein
MKNQNNQTIAYKCSSNLQNVENFENIGGTVMGQRYPINGNSKGNETLNNLTNADSYNNVFQVNQDLPPFKDSSNKIDFFNLKIGATAEGLGKYGEDWIYVVTGPMIPKNTWIISLTKNNVPEPRPSTNTWIVATRSIGGVYRAGDVLGKALNIYPVTKTPLGGLSYSVSEILNKDYNTAGQFIGSTAV